MNIIDAMDSYIYDSEGNTYINFAESTNIFGHRNKGISDFISTYVSEHFIHYPITVSYPNIAHTVESKLKLVSGIRDGRAIYSSSGSEGCDIALSILSEFGPVVTVRKGYHGNSGQFINKANNDKRKFNWNFEVEFPSSDDDLREIKECVYKGAKSIIIEPLQVEGGIREIPYDYISNIKKNFPNLLICVDETYTGLGKTGNFFSFQQYGFIPDVLIVGKSIGGGIPLGVTMVSSDVFEKSKVAESFRNGAFGSSSGNLLSLHLASYIIEKVQESSFLEEVNTKSKMFDEILGSKYRSRLTGKGLIRGIVFQNPDSAYNASDRLKETGVFATPMANALRLSPPLNIKKEVLKEGLEKIRDSAF